MSERLPSSAVSFIKTKVCQYEIGRAGAGAVLLIGLGYISPDSKLEGNRSKPVGVTVKKCKKAPLIGAGDGAICSKNRKIVPYHGANPNTRNGARLRSPSPIIDNHANAKRMCFSPRKTRRRKQNLRSIFLKYSYCIGCSK